MSAPNTVIVGHGVVPGAITVEVANRYDVADGVVALDLVRPDDGELPPWTPGAHVDVILTDNLIRQYSLCGDIRDRTRWRIAVLREEAGRGGSAYIHREIVQGSLLTVSEPRNHFELVPAEKYLFIAGGIGITPIVAMIQAQHVQAAEWKLHYGGRTMQSMAFVDELSAQCNGRVVLHPQDRVGLLDLAEILGQPDESTTVYCCGPAALINAVEGHCQAWRKGALRVERFQPKELSAPVVDGTFEVELRRSGQLLQVSPDESVLDAVRNVGIPVASSCEEGTCGTCEVSVLEGEVDHRDSLLSDDEQAANDTMFICVSRARCPRLVLDL